MPVSPSWSQRYHALYITYTNATISLLDLWLYFVVCWFTPLFPSTVNLYFILISAHFATVTPKVTQCNRQLEILINLHYSWPQSMRGIQK